MILYMQQLLENNFYVSYKKIGDVLGENKYAVKNQHDKFLYDNKAGRPSKLNDEQFNLAIQRISFIS